MPDFQILPLTDTPNTRRQLCELLVDTVAAGGSVSFMHPLPYAQAEAFWEGSLAVTATGGRILLGVWEGELLQGSVTLLLDFPPNQPHRAEIAKMMTHPRARGRGIASALLQHAEALAQQHGRTHLMLDTASDGGAAGLYKRMGYHLAGEIPDFALKPHGGLTGTLFFWKKLEKACGV